MKQLVSIIVPIYNSEPYIAQTLQSCVDQSHRELEIIAVDDGSTDRSGTIIQSFSDSRIRYFRTENSGACASRNFGLQHSRGELIQFLDHDDLLKHDKLEHQVRAYREWGDEWLYSARMGSVSGQHCSLDGGYDLYERDFSPVEYFQTVLNQFSRHVTTGAWLVPRKLVEGIDGWDARCGLNDDGEYFMRILLQAKGIKFCPGAEFYFRRDVPNSLSKQKHKREVFEKWLFSYRSYVNHFREAWDTDTARELGWKALSVFYCNAYPNVPDLRAECRQEMRNLGYDRAFPIGGERFIRVATWVGTDHALRLWNVKRLIRGE